MELYFMKGQTGIGTLIVFIALVLTAAIAAFLITQTTVATQSKAAAVADQARERTGTTLEIVRVEG
ncbi:MAG: archaellin/type IV pilin N-terminal domain-containing protein, partial [Nanopusillaceae archaeon]